MPPFISYKNGELHVEGVTLSAIAREVATPFYCYSQSGIEQRYRDLAAALSGFKHTICYAVKANSNIAVLSALGALGCGADVVSIGEMQRALKAAIPAGKIVFAGTGKTDDEIRFALKQGIMQFNVESLPELVRINDIAKEMGMKAPVVLRVNPDVEANTHAHITTGTKENKFGIDAETLAQIKTRIPYLSHINLLGLGLHIGSQITELEPYTSSYEYLRDLVVEWRAAGIEITQLDLGGGIGIAYRENQQTLPLDIYAAEVKRLFGDLNCHLVFEPGRLLVGDAGLLVTKVLYVKETAHKNFIIVDAGMNDLMRPALYDAHHEIRPVVANSKEKILADVVGPVCESSDFLALSRNIEKPQPKDLLAVFQAGAYGASMSSVYNSRPQIPEVLIKDQGFHVIKKRLALSQLWEHETLAAWQQPGY